jgi:hypothetical protein
MWCSKRSILQTIRVAGALKTGQIRLRLSVEIFLFEELDISSHHLELASRWRGVVMWPRRYVIVSFDQLTRAVKGPL